MVRQCQVCGKLDTYNPKLSFHRIPVEIEKRKLWYSLLGFVEGRRLPKRPEVCSDHFDPSDIVVKGNGLRYLKSGINPQPVDDLFPQSIQSEASGVSRDHVPKDSVDVHSSSDTDSAPETERHMEKSTHISEKVSRDHVPKDSVDAHSLSDTDTAPEITERRMEKSTISEKVSRDHVPKDSVDVHSLSDTDTAPELTERHMEKSTISEKHINIIDNLSSNDFATPAKCKYTLNIVKRNFFSQERHIRDMTMEVETLKKRITFLKNTLDT